MLPHLSNAPPVFPPEQSPFFTLFSALWEAIYPPRCAACDAFETAIFCASCRATLREAPPRIPLLHSPEYSEEQENELRFARAAFLFEGALREAVHRFKYGGETSLAAPLAHLMNAHLGNLSTQDAVLVRDSVLVPVPMHGWRKWRRGYNQSELLARELAKISGAPMQNILQRARYTVTQTELSRDERRANIEGAFVLDEAFMLNEKAAPSINGAPTFILIDDVLTTGATLRECARVLQEHFPRSEIRACTLAWQPLS